MRSDFLPKELTKKLTKKLQRFLTSLLVPSLFASASVVAWAAPQSAKPFPVIIVDKSKAQIHLTHSDAVTGEMGVVKSHHVTVGKVKGDKLIENDLKTPEGFYLFTARLKPPAIKPKFGAMALMMNYPNPIDRMQGKTGYDIMLHSTNDPPRLQRDQDSEGCVVVDDLQVLEFSGAITLGLTPILVYDELKPEYLNTKLRGEVGEAFLRWLTGWMGKDLDAYIGAYSPGFRYNGMNIKQYRDYKAALNKKYLKINVVADNVRLFMHPKYAVVYFTQRYDSELKNGQKAFQSDGTKWLYFVKDDSGRYLIQDESFSNLREN